MIEGQRRLAAIMFTDMVGFTALTQSDESQSLAVLERHNRLLRPIFSKFRGREVKAMGDSFLVEFESALDATNCAVEVQRFLHDYNISSKDDWKITLRIGVHLGDIVHSGGDILGDAVNVASRLQPLAEPEGVCISEQVHDQVRNKVPQMFLRLEARDLKGVRFPIDVYKIVMPWEKENDEPKPHLDSKRIAVLPFVSMSPDPADEFFAEGMTEELTNTISHNIQLKVIARTSAGRYKGTSKSISEIGNEIGVGSILEGSIRKAGNRVRVTAQLIDASTEYHLWSDNYDRELDDIFSIQSEIAKHVTEALAAKLIPSEQKAVKKRATVSSTAYVRYLKGRALLRDRTKASMMEAKKLFEDAIAQDGNYAEALVGLADAYSLLASYEFIPTQEARFKGRQALSKALALDEGLAEAHNTFAQFLADDYKFEEAEKEFRKAIDLNPNYALAHHWFAICLLEMGRVRESFEETRLAEELDPLSPALTANITVDYDRLGIRSEVQRHLEKLKELDADNKFLDFYKGLMAQLKGDYATAAPHLEAALRSNPDNYGYASFLGQCYGKLGDREKARTMLEKIQSLPQGTFGRSFKLAMIYGGLLEKDEMFRLLGEAFEEHSIMFRALRSPALDEEIKLDPRYLALFAKANLTP